MEIRWAKKEELETINELYKQGRAFMQRTGNPRQWGDTYPSSAILAEDISLNRLYVVTENKEIIAAFCFFFGLNVEPTYRYIDGEWLKEGPYGVLHRVVSAGKKRRIVDLCVDWCLQICPSLRVDTHRDNKRMQEALTRCGCRYCGIIFLNDGTERLAYQKISEKKE